MCGWPAGDLAGVVGVGLGAQEALHVGQPVFALRRRAQLLVISQGRAHRGRSVTTAVRSLLAAAHQGTQVDRVVTVRVPRCGEGG